MLSFGGNKMVGGYSAENASGQYKFQAGFDKGLDAYKGARDEGLRPKGTTVKAVEETHKQVKSQKRALKKLKKYGTDVSELKTVPGVK